MKLKNLKISRKTTAIELAEPTMGPDGNDYPWGTNLDFNKELLEILPEVGKIPAGSDVDIIAKGFIRSVNVDQDQKPTQVSLQITDIAIANKESFGQSFQEAAKKDGNE